MNRVIFTLILLVGCVCPTFAKRDQPALTGACLAVMPSPPESKGCMGGLGYYAGCYVYLESANLPIHEIKRSYLKRDLEKLEDRQVKVIVTGTGSRAQYCSLPAPEGVQ